MVVLDSRQRVREGKAETEQSAITLGLEQVVSGSHAHHFTPALPATAPEILEKLNRATDICLKYEQLPIKTDHVLHAGMYARTVTMPPNTIVIGTLIKVPTLVITVGSAKVLVGEDWADVDGYQVLPARAGRKQIFVSKGPFIITMLFPTQAKSVGEAEAEFTDETHLLLSRKQEFMNTAVITGE